LVRPAPPGTREQDLQQARVVVREVADQAQKAGKEEAVSKVGREERQLLGSAPEDGLRRAPAHAGDVGHAGKDQETALPALLNMWNDDELDTVRCRCRCRPSPKAASRATLSGGCVPFGPFGPFGRFLRMRGVAAGK
jgi:hypothetical protein